MGSMDICIGKNGCYKDHLGNYYSSAKSMSDCWRISYHLFKDRIYLGWSVEKALTYGNDKTEPDKDESVIYVFGEPFPSYYAIDKAYGYANSCAYKHKDNLEEWLMSRGTFFVDDRLFRTASELSITYGIVWSTIRKRLKKGMSLSDAVHTPLVEHHRNGKSTKDHLGNEYDSLGEMLLKYNMTYENYSSRKSAGWDLCRILTTPVNKELMATPEKTINPSKNVTDKFLAAASKM